MYCIKTYLSPRLTRGFDTSFFIMITGWPFDLDDYDNGLMLNPFELAQEKPKEKPKEGLPMPVFNDKSEKYFPFINLYSCEDTVNELRKKQDIYLYMGLGPFYKKKN